MSNDHSPYRILGQIGQGQFGRVFCAINRHTGEIVALKDLKLRGFPTKKFLRELDFILTAEHPHIVACNALRYHRYGRYLVMDYCEGGTLRDLMDLETSLSLEQKLKLVEDVLSGLAQAHSCHIIHCDIKPENILLNIIPSGWLARLTDFGIARLLEENTANQPGGYTGSPAYMAPERFYGQHYYATDIYAMGIILYELLTGYRPFSGFPGELMTAHLSKPVKIPDTVPEILHPIIEKALRKLPQRRFATANDMKKVIQQARKKLAFTSSSLFTSPVTIPSEPLTIFSQISLSTQVTHLASNYPYLYLGMGNKLAIYHDTGEDLNCVGQVNLDGVLSQLSPHAQGYICLNQLGQEHQQISYYLNSQPLQAFATYDLLGQNSLSLLALRISSNWLAVTTNSQLQILKLPDLSPISPLVNCPQPAQLITLDSCHGLAIFAAAEGIPNTTFKLFNRRGKVVDAFSLPLHLDNFTYNPSIPYLLLALEPDKPELAVLIQLKPLKVTRIAFDFFPCFTFPFSQGFGVANSQGIINLINPQGKRLSSLGMEREIKAITPWGEQGFILVSNLNQSESLELYTGNFL